MFFKHPDVVQVSFHADVADNAYPMTGDVTGILTVIIEKTRKAVVSEI